MAYDPFTDAETAYKYGIGQDWMRKLKGNLEAHQERLDAQDARVDEMIRTHFHCDTINSDSFDSAGTFTSKVGSAAGHVMEIAPAGSTGDYCGGLGGASKKLRFRLLDGNIAVLYEARVIETVTGFDQCLFGCNTASLPVAAPGASSAFYSLTNAIGFAKGTNTDTYKFVCGTSSSDNVGQRSVLSTLKVLVEMASSVAEVHAYIDGAEISGSPFATGIPTSAILRPVAGFRCGSTAVRWQIDLFNAYLNAALVDM